MERGTKIVCGDKGVHRKQSQRVEVENKGRRQKGPREKVEAGAGKGQNAGRDTSHGVGTSPSGDQKEVWVLPAKQAAARLRVHKAKLGAE